MHLNAQPPVFVPEQFRKEIEGYSKAALMDIAWDLAQRASGADDLNGPSIMEEFRDTARIIMSYRKQEAPEQRKKKRELKASFR